MKEQLNQTGQQLAALLRHARQYQTQLGEQRDQAEKVHVVGAGGTLTAAYEQLRNAAEYAEEHMLLQRAIRRFYRRLFMTRDTKVLAASGDELAIELTHAGYLANDSVPAATFKEISLLAADYYAAYETLQKNRDVSRKQAEEWTLDVLAVNIEWKINDPSLTTAYLQFVHNHYVSNDTLRSLFSTMPADFEPAVYTAINRALLKVDQAQIRAGLLYRYQVGPADLDRYISVNQQIDDLFESETTEKVYRFVDRRGAPLRILKHMIEEDDTLHETLERQDEFLSHYATQVNNEYASINKRINRGIIRSVVFLIITKFLVGLAIEIPYDYFVLGSIALVPLLINLLFPPIYMVILRMTLLLPGEANTAKLSSQIEQILYGGPKTELMRKRQANFGIGYNIAYALVFVLVFGGVGYWLYSAFHFELLHLFIFFLFLSGASFLGFRLSRTIREIEAVDSDQNAVTTIRDFLYMPFVVVGRYMSEKYTQVNIVALSLDMLIELPLKTVLRLIRQWGAFISSKKDAL